MLHLVNHCLFHSMNLCFGSMRSVHMLYMITWSRLWLVACHFKNYFVITYLLEDKQELSLGILIRLRRMYNFLCSMLDYISVPHVLIMFLYHFGMIYGTNLLTRCPEPVPIFYCLFISEKLFWEVSRNALKIYGNYSQAETSPEPEGRLQGGPQPPGTTQVLAVARAHLVPSGIVFCRPFTYKIIFDPKTLSTQSYFSEDVRGRRRCQP